MATGEDHERLLARLREARPDLADRAVAALLAAITTARTAWPEVQVDTARFIAFLAPSLGDPADPVRRPPPRRPLPRVRLRPTATPPPSPRSTAPSPRCWTAPSPASAPPRPSSPSCAGRPRAPAGRPRRRRRHAHRRLLGRGGLAAWVRVVATREAARLLRKERRHEPTEDDELARVLAPDAGPELDYLKRLYRDEFKNAVHAAIAGLSDRERLVLRQHALDGLSIDQLAALHRVHRATTARWIAGARKAVLDGTRRALTDRLRLRPAELDSILRLIDSQLDVSLPGLLRDEPA
jgi:RNA polymerase sigma factor (sigma-70 family)